MGPGRGKHIEHSDLIRQCEDYLENGRIGKAAAVLTSINLDQLPAPERRSVAILARRAQCYNLGLRALSPRMGQNPTEAEKAEYAALLLGLGASAEALDLLATVDVDVAPEALIYFAQGKFAQWDFQSAADALERFCLHPAPSPWARALAGLSLLSAFVSSEQWERAEELIAQLESSLPEAPRLQYLFQHTRGELAVAQGDFVAAELFVRRAERLCADHASQLATRKLRAVITLVTTGDSAPLTHVRSDAREAEEWEIVRSCDIELMKHAGTQELFDKLYGGTPVTAFREALVRFTGRRFKVPRETVRGEGHNVFDLTTGQINGSDVFSRKKTLHRVLVALARDGYRPLKVGGLFAAVFPNEPFDVHSSPDRLHQLLFRLRAMLRGCGSPLEIVEENQFYRAVIQPGWTVALEVSAGAIVPSQVARLKQIFGHDYFTPKRARESLNLTPSALRRMIRSALDANLLVQEGRGPACRYRVAS